MSAIQVFPPPIRRYLGDYVARCRRLRVVRAGLVTLAFAVAWTLLVALLDRALALPAWARVGLLMAEAAGVVLILVGPIRGALRRRVDWVEASVEIERRNASLGQRLVTITSQLLTPANYRGSPAMIDALVSDVSAEISAAPSGRLVEWGALVRPALLASGLLLAAFALSRVEWLNLTQLVARQLRPLSAIPPVTTTLIDLAPAGASVREHEPVPIKALVRHLSEGGAVPTIHFTTDGGRQWDSLPMTPTVEHTYAYTLPAVRQDVQYYVTAGDATSEQYLIRVLRRPAVAEFRVRYTYPAYTGRGSLSVHNTDGLIEAPQGSEAVISVVATEPLVSAVIKLGDGKRLETTATGEGNIRQVRLTVDKDRRWELEMTSDRGVEGKGPPSGQMRAVPDRPPLVRLIQPATDLRLSPREIVPLSYQALDDYGVGQLVARAQVNANPPVEYPLRLRGTADVRRIEGTFDLDLAPMKLKVGDVVSIAVAATDRAGQKGSSDVRHVLVSPRSIDVATHQRLAELAQAVEYARDWSGQLEKAQKALEKARAERADQPAALAKAGRMVATAQEAGSMLRQSLLRAMMYSASPRMSDALAQMVDAATYQADGLDRVDEAVLVKRGVDEQAAARMGRTVSAAKELARQVKQLADGDQAAAVLADRLNLKAAPSTAPTDAAALERRKQMLDRAKQDVETALTSLGIKRGEGSTDAQLQQRIDAAAQVIAGAKAVDFTAAAKRWAGAIASEEPQPPHLDERLAAASQAETVRPDAELVAARDLQLASRAAAALSSTIDSQAEAGAKKDRADALGEFAATLAALRAEHDLNRRAMAAATLADFRKVHDAGKAVHATASAARAKMVAWASGPAASADDVAVRTREAEDLALAANAATGQRDYDRAGELDKRLAGALNRPELADAAAAPRALDRLSVGQEKVADETTAAGGDERRAADVAGAQRQVAEEIGKTDADPASAQAAADSAEARQRATEAISAAQERLASLPMQLTTAQQLAEALADVSARLAVARADAAKASPARQEGADRVAGMVQAEYDEAKRNFEGVVGAMKGKLPEELAEGLRPLGLDAAGAVSAIDVSLRAALGDVQEALQHMSETGDRAGVEPAAQTARDAIAQVQEALREAQGRVIERDPLVSAKWFAKAAADALAGANKRSAATHQKRTLEALNKAAVDAIRRSKNQRLSQVPAYAPLYLPPLSGNWADAGEGGRSNMASERLLQTIPGLREWGRLRERMGGDPLAAPVRETDPPGYSDALRIYFEVLGREEDKSGKP